MSLKVIYPLSLALKRAKMTAEQIFLLVSFCVLGTILLYEIVFILFFKDATGNEKKMDSVLKESEDVLVQPKPLGYTEPSVKNYDICPSPVFELPEEEQSTQESVVEDQITILESIEVIRTPEQPRKNSFGKAPNIVVSSEIETV